MKRFNVGLILLTLLIFACANGKEGAIEETPVQETQENTKTTEVMDEERIRELEARIPLIDNIDVDFVNNRFYAEAELYGKDANYYNTYVHTDKTYHIKVEATNKNTALIIIAADGQLLLRQTLEQGPLEWKGQFEKAGAAVFQVGLKSGSSSPLDNTNIKIDLLRE